MDIRPAVSSCNIQYLHVSAWPAGDESSTCAMLQFALTPQQLQARESMENSEADLVSVDLSRRSHKSAESAQRSYKAHKMNENFASPRVSDTDGLFIMD